MSESAMPARVSRPPRPMAEKILLTTFATSAAAITETTRVMIKPSGLAYAASMPSIVPISPPTAIAMAIPPTIPIREQSCLMKPLRQPRKTATMAKMRVIMSKMFITL